MGAVSMKLLTICPTTQHTADPSGVQYQLSREQIENIDGVREESLIFKLEVAWMACPSWNVT
jgi:hypothetical protein